MRVLFLYVMYLATNDERLCPCPQIYSGGSVGGAALMNSGEADICLNWAGAAL